MPSSYPRSLNGPYQKGRCVISLPLGSWFPVQVLQRQEKKVMSFLEYKGYEILLPTRRSRAGKCRDKSQMEVPLFPGYLFCRVQPSASGMILTTPGVIRIVCFGGKPCAVHDEEIDAVCRIASSGVAVHPFPYCEVGHRVRVTSKPFAGIEGVVVQVKKENRLIISVDAIMKSISIALDAEDVEPVRTAVTNAA